MFAFIFIVTLIFSRLEPHVEEVDAQYVSERKGMPGYVLVDARPEDQYLGKSPRHGVPGGHIPGALSFPFEDLKIPAASAALSKAGITKDKTVIVYCNTGVLSGRFADQLVRRFNFSASRIKNYRGSTVDWVRNPRNILLPPGHETGFIEDVHSQRFRGK
ncbi:MAG: hypothetical protein IJG65_06295 [Synergistaceae bacterium]|nr:hypothetical protein [Synergistaceae bacterium]